MQRMDYIKWLDSAVLEGSMQQVKGCLPNTMNPFQNIGSTFTLFAEYKPRFKVK